MAIILYWESVGRLHLCHVVWSLPYMGKDQDFHVPCTTSYHTMKPSKLLHSLSLRLQGRFSQAPVAPWPERMTTDKWLHDELDDLRLLVHWPSQCHMSIRFITRALEVAVDAHQQAIKFITTAAAENRRMVEKFIIDYMEDIIELLDVCNSLRDRTETIRRYIVQLETATHYLAGGECEPLEAAVERAHRALRSSERMEGCSCSELDKCHSKLKRLTEKTVADTVDTDQLQLLEVLSGAKAMTLLVCRMLSMGLSFKSKKGLGVYHAQCASSWSDLLLSLQREIREEIEKSKTQEPLMEELRKVVVTARALRGLISGRSRENGLRSVEMRGAVSTMERHCKELAEGVEQIEKRVAVLYKQLISLRMALLERQCL